MVLTFLRRACAVASCTLFATQIEAAEKLISTNLDTRTVLAFRVSNEAVRKLLPAGWELDAAPDGPNLRVVFANNLLVRTAADPMSVASLMRKAIYAADADTAIDRVQTLEHVRSDAVASPRLTAILLAMFAGLALVITAAGIAGVMSLSVSQRKHELGVRLALGATPANVLRMVMGQGMSFVLLGLSIGVAGALLLGRLMSALLFSVLPTDPIAFVAVSAVLILVAAAACFVPARRVTSIDPMIALRSE